MFRKNRLENINEDIRKFLDFGADVLLQPMAVRIIPQKAEHKLTKEKKI